MSPDATILIENNQDSLRISSLSKAATIHTFHKPTKMKTDTFTSIGTNDTIVSPTTSDIAIYKAALIQNDADSVFLQVAKKCQTTMFNKNGKEANEVPSTTNCLPSTTHSNDEPNVIISDTSDSSISESDDGYQSSVSSLDDNQDVLDEDDWNFKTTENTPTSKDMSNKSGRRRTKRPISSDVSENNGVSNSNNVLPMTPNLPPMTPSFKKGSVGPIRPRPSLPGRDYFLSPSVKRRVVVKSNRVNEWPFSTMMQSSGKISLIHFDHRPNKDGSDADKRDSNKRVKGEEGRQQRASSDVLDAALTLSSWLPHEVSTGVPNMSLYRPRLACHSEDK